MLKRLRRFLIKRRAALGGQAEHLRQLFPLNKVGEWIGANDKTYGLEKRNKTNFIVTSGLSDWAIKFKTGTKSEFVVIDVKRKAATEKKGK